jgi:hypothetical protein
MDTLDYWTPADALAFRCSVEQVGTLKPAEVLPSGESGISDLARAYAPRALRALARVAEEGSGRPAVEAARLLLALAYPAPLPSPAASPAASPDLPAPAWLDPSRLAYQADACLGNGSHDDVCLGNH